MQWKKYSKEIPEVGDICVIRFGGNIYHIAKFTRPYDSDEKFNPEYYLWVKLDMYLLDSHEEWKASNHDEWIKIDTKRNP